jgi:hypothetical protein
MLRVLLALSLMASWAAVPPGRDPGSPRAAPQQDEERAGQAEYDRVC